MDFKHYQYVLKVAELQNMTKAANELYVSQPALSHYIAKVEDELGAVLFDRNTTPLSLTPAGERYVETARMVLALNDRLRQDISDINEQKKGRVILGISHARASFFLPYVLLLEHGISPSRIFETTSNETAYRLSSVGMGISIVPESTILLSHPVAEPFCYHIGENDFFWKIGAVYRQRECLTKAQRAFIGILQQCFDVTV